MRTIETIFHLSLIASAFIAYFSSYLHWAFWFAVAWAVYLFIANTVFQKAMKNLEDLDERVTALHERVRRHAE